MTVRARHLLTAAIAGAASAAGVLAAVSGAAGGVLVAYVAPTPLMIVGLIYGFASAVLAGAIGAGLAWALGGVALAALFAAVNAVPAAIVAWFAAPAAAGPDGAPPLGRVLAHLAVYAAALVVVVTVAAGGGAEVRDVVAEQLRDALTGAFASFDGEERESLVNALAPVFIGGSSAIWLIVVVVNAAIAESMARTKRPGGARPRWSQVALPDWLSWPLATAAAVGLVADGDLAFVARNVVLALGVAYFFQGLATIHVFAAGMNGRVAALAGVYGATFLFFLFAAPLIAFVGMIDQWAGLRARRASRFGT